MTTFNHFMRATLPLFLSFCLSLGFANANQGSLQTGSLNSQIKPFGLTGQQLHDLNDSREIEKHQLDKFVESLYQKWDVLLGKGFIESTDLVDPFFFLKKGDLEMLNYQKLSNKQVFYVLEEFLYKLKNNLDYRERYFGFDRETLLDFADILQHFSLKSYSKTKEFKGYFAKKYYIRESLKQLSFDHDYIKKGYYHLFSSLEDLLAYENALQNYHQNRGLFEGKYFIGIARDGLSMSELFAYLEYFGLIRLEGNQNLYLPGYDSPYFFRQVTQQIFEDIATELGTREQRFFSHDVYQKFYSLFKIAMGEEAKIIFSDKEGFKEEIIIEESGDLIKYDKGKGYFYVIEDISNQLDLFPEEELSSFVLFDTWASGKTALSLRYFLEKKYPKSESDIVLGVSKSYAPQLFQTISEYRYEITTWPFRRKPMSETLEENDKNLYTEETRDYRLVVNTVITLYRTLLKYNFAAEKYQEQLQSLEKERQFQQAS